MAYQMGRTRSWKLSTKLLPFSLSQEVLDALKLGLICMVVVVVIAAAAAAAVQVSHFTVKAEISADLT